MEYKRNNARTRRKLKDKNSKRPIYVLKQTNTPSKIIANFVEIS